MQRQPKRSPESRPGPVSTEDAIRARRDVVLKAARSVFETKGLEEASIRLIAKTAGVTTGAIYPYFSGKEEIYAELLMGSLDTIQAELIRATATIAGPEERFRAALDTFFGYYETRPNDLSLALYLFRGLKPQGLTPELNERTNRKAGEILAFIKDTIKAVGGMDDRAAELELGLHVSFLFGVLTLHHAKRSRLLGVEARDLLALHIQHSVHRLARQ